MVTHWRNGVLNFELKYWKRAFQDFKSDLIGTISFRLICNKLPDGKAQVGPTHISVILKRQCHYLIKDLAFRHEMYEAEILDMIALAFEHYRVDISSIESDSDRMLREFNEQSNQQMC